MSIRVEGARRWTTRNGDGPGGNCSVSGWQGAGGALQSGASPREPGWFALCSVQPRNLGGIFRRSEGVEFEPDFYDYYTWRPVYSRPMVRGRTGLAESPETCGHGDAQDRWRRVVLRGYVTFAVHRWRESIPTPSSYGQSCSWPRLKQGFVTSTALSAISVE